MRKSTWLVTLFIMLSFIWAKEVKIAYIDSEKLRTDWSEWKDAQAKFDRTVAQWQEKAQALQDTVQQLMEDYQRQELLLSEEKRREKQMLIAQKQRDYQDFLTSIFGQGGLAEQKNRELTAPLLEKIKSALGRIADREGYTLILDIAGENIAYIDPTLDITDELLTELKKGK